MSEEFAWGQGHGKAILVGEHFVLDGATALATGLPGFVTRVGLRSVREDDRWTPIAARGSLRFLTKSEGFASPPQHTLSAPGSEELQASLQMVEMALERAGAPLAADIVVSGNVPLGRGLGSSAAFAVASVRAAWRFASLTAPAETVGREVAREMETIVHGQSSGLDPAAAWSDALVLFRDGVIQRGQPPAQGAIAQARWLIVDLGAAPATRTAIARANEARTRMGGAQLSVLVADVDCAANRAFAALLGDDVDGLAEAMATAAAALNHLDVVDERMRSVLARCLDAGALAAKPTGAGLGGALLALAPTAAIAETVRAGLGTTVRACHILEISR